MNTGYTLYNRDGSGGFVVEAALVLADAPFELVSLDSKPGTPLPESFKNVNPWGQVPVLLTPSGTRLTESAAILTHLAAAHPDKSLAPAPGTDEHGLLLRWMTFMTVILYECVLRAGYAERYTADPNGALGVAHAATASAARGLQVLEAELGENDYLIANDFSVADLYAAMMTAWLSDGKNTPRLDALTHKVASHPKIAPIWQRQFDSRLSRKWGR